MFFDLLSLYLAIRADFSWSSTLLDLWPATLSARFPTTNSRSAMAMTHHATQWNMLNFRRFIIRMRKFHRKFYCSLCVKLLNHSRQACKREVAIAWAFIKKMFRVNSPKNSNIVEKFKNLQKESSARRVERNFVLFNFFFASFSVACYNKCVLCCCLADQSQRKTY